MYDVDVSRHDESLMEESKRIIIYIAAQIKCPDPVAKLNNKSKS